MPSSRRSSKPANLTQSEVNSPVSEAMLKAKERKKCQTQTAAIHNAQQNLDSSKPDRRVTRLRSSQFPFLRLPVEIRNKIYDLATKPEKALELNKLRIPKLPQACRQIRGEAMGSFTANNKVEFKLRSSCLLREKALTGPGHLYFPNIGSLPLHYHQMKWMQKEDVVFRHIEIDVLCACCPDTKIGYFTIITKQGVATMVKQAFWRHELELVELCFEGMANDMRKLLDEFQKREKFSGLTFADLQKVAACFRWAGPIKLNS